MDDPYVLWSGRSAGWLTRGGTYSSDLASARTYSYNDAMAYAKVHYKNGMSEFGLLPIRLSDLQALRNE